MKKITPFVQLQILLFALLLSAFSFAQVGIGTNAPANGSVLDVTSADKGFLVPRVDIVDLATIAPVTGGATVGLLVWNTNVGTGVGFHYWDGADWIPISGGSVSADWALAGNAAGGADFLGTTNAEDLRIQTNSNLRMRVLADGRVIVNEIAGPFFAGDAFTAEGDFAVNGYTTTGIGVYGEGTSGDGTWGVSDSGDGVFAATNSGLGVNAFSALDTAVLGDGGFNGVSGVGLNAGVFGGGGLAGVIGNAGANVGVLGVTTSGIGVDGEATDNAGFGGQFLNTGALGQGLIAAGNNVVGITIPASGIGMTGSGATYGSGGFASNANSTGVLGVANGIATFSTIAPNGSGVAGTGTDVGIAGFGTATTSIGTIGFGGNANGVGAQGQGDFGVVGLGGVQGVQGAGTNGVVGFAAGGATANFGVFSVGNFGGSGAKYFVIDHPLEPENKLLRHANIESNEILNLYRGKAEFDAGGKAVVDLPDYYAAININPSYQLTPIGAAMPNLYIEREVENGQFVIAGGVPGKKVSWQITAERNDLFIQNNPDSREMELDKGNKRGKYVDPLTHSKSLELSYFKRAESQRSVTEKISKYDSRKTVNQIQLSDTKNDQNRKAANSSERVSPKQKVDKQKNN